MTIFLVALIFVLILIAWQLLVYLRVPQGTRARKTVLVRILLLVVVLALCTYALRAALMKEVRFSRMLLPYPGAQMNLIETPVFSDSPYWTYRTSDSADQVFNWYRSRSKHAGWTVAEDGVGEGTRVFVIRIDKTTSFFVVLKVEPKGTTITYTTEGQLVRQSTIN